MTELTDIEKLTEALRKERADHKATKEKHGEQLNAAHGRIKEYELLGPNANAGVIAEHMTNAAKAALAAGTAELQAKLATVEAELAESRKTGETLNGQLTQRAISEATREACRESHVRSEAINDVLTFAANELKLVDGEVRTEDGRDVATWLDDRKATSPYLWPAARGAGARGMSGGGDGAPIHDGQNPFKPGPTFSLTKQGEIMQTNPERAKMLQAQATKV
jgi:hypothetical protein